MSGLGGRSGETDCTCAALLIETNAHEDVCAISQERWSDPQYVALREAACECGHPSDDHDRIGLCSPCFKSGDRETTCVRSSPGAST